MKYTRKIYPNEERGHVRRSNTVRHTDARGQLRKYTYEPYIEHPVAVADLVEEYMDARRCVYDDEAIMTAMTIAVLHDVVEDTEATMEDIVELFGEEVATGVWFLTKCPDYVGNRATRKRYVKIDLPVHRRSLRLLRRLICSITVLL